ncbi:MAG: hypothetical protein H7256_13855 [Bdellovibrio sp.]|nr:hypothetical protein [Bdellovibrio sp.]
MKRTLILALLVFSQFSFAGTAKVERELTREKAKEIMASKETESKEKYLGKIAEMAADAGSVKGLSLNIKKALLQGDADLLMTVYKATAKKDTATLKFIGETSAGVRTAKEAVAIANLAESGAGEKQVQFRTELAKEVENGKSVEEALKAASKTLGYKGDKEITLEKFPC